MSNSVTIKLNEKALADMVRRHFSIPPWFGKGQTVWHQNVDGGRIDFHFSESKPEEEG